MQANELCYKHIQRKMLKRKSFLVVTGAFVFIGTTYVSYALTAKPKVTYEADLPTNPNERTKAIYNSVAKKYDSSVGLDETLIGVSRLRSRVIKDYVTGPHVLEVASGTGRNFEHFWDNKQKFESITCTDFSKDMLQEAFDKYHARKTRGRITTDKFTFKIVDAHAMSKALPNDFYDTVLDTYGLCSFQDPQRVVREMVNVCSPTGQLVFLEHGKSSKYGIVNNYLDKHADSHHSKWGCWWNRDIEKILTQDCADVINVKELKRYQLGTCYLVIAKPIKK
jgi:methyltransferase OMS1